MVMSITLHYLAAMAACTMFASAAFAQSARDIRGPSPLVAIENEPPPKLIVDPPLSFTGPNAIIATNAKALTDLEFTKFQTTESFRNALK